MPRPPRAVEAVCEVPGFAWDVDALSRMFAVLDTHALATRAPAGTVALAFLDNPASAALHRNFFDDPEPTDVMTFPGDPDEDHAGDIAANIDIAREEAPEARWTSDEELTLYLVHGWLHLAGFRDDTTEATAAMRAAENDLLNHLRAHEALPAFTWP
ncbi:MAG: rRNA maturation RNase YbeY [Opitutales bacterium]|nr:rRNA maturation RNase YbeY [Opitutales bacterium]